MYLLGHKTYLIKRGKVLSLSSNFFQGFGSFSELFQLLMQLKKKWNKPVKVKQLDVQGVKNKGSPIKQQRVKSR